MVSGLTARGYAGRKKLLTITPDQRRFGRYNPGMVRSRPPAIYALLVLWGVAAALAGCPERRTGGGAKAGAMGKGKLPGQGRTRALHSTGAATPAINTPGEGSPGQGPPAAAKKAKRPPGFYPNIPLPEDSTAAWEKDDRDGQPKPHGDPWDFTFTFRNTPPTQDGPFIMNWPDGKKRLVGKMCKGNACGTWTSYYKNGQKQREGSYQGGNQEGTWTGWYESGKLRGQGQYKKDNAYGLFREWHPSGKLWQRYHWHPDGGRLHGPWVMLYEDGSKSESGAYEEGVPVGPWRLWYDNGQVEEEMTWVAGKEQGPITQWDRQGRIIARGVFKDAVPVAPWECRLADGTMKRVPPPKRPHSLPTRTCELAGLRKPARPAGKAEDH